MPIFEYTSPEGQTYEVEAPDGATYEQGLEKLQSHLANQAENVYEAPPVIDNPDMHPPLVDMNDVPTDTMLDTIQVNQEERMEKEKENHFDEGIDFLEQVYNQIVDLLPQGGGKSPVKIGAFGYTLPIEFDSSISKGLIGSAETAQTFLSGATTGSLASTAQFFTSLINRIVDGTIGTEEGAKKVEEETFGKLERYTATPRTEEGQRLVKEWGGVMQKLFEPLGPAFPLQPEMASLHLPGKLSKVATAKKYVPILRSIKKKTGPMDAVDIAKTAKKAATGRRSENAKVVLQELASPDQEKLAAAKRLGIADYVQPDHITTNHQYREVAQAMKSFIGSEGRKREIEGFEKILAKANDTIEKLGGDLDLSQVNERIKLDMQKTEEKFHTRARNHFDNVSAVINPSTEVETPNFNAFIEQQSEDFGGLVNLTPLERRLRRELTPTKDRKLTYAKLDAERKKLTRARVKKQGEDVYVDADENLLLRLEKEVMSDQKAIANQFGVLEEFENAQRTSAHYLSYQKDLYALFGKQLDKSFVSKLWTSVQQVSRGDVSHFENLMNTIKPSMLKGGTLSKVKTKIITKEMLDVAASGLISAFSRSAKEEKLNFNSFTKWYEGAQKNRAAYNTLMEYMPEGTAQKLKDFYTISEGISRAAKERVSTGRINSIKDSITQPGNLAKRLYELGGVGVASLIDTSNLGAFYILKSMLTKENSKNAVLKSVDEFIFSDQFMELVRTGNVQKAARSTTFREIAKMTGLTQPELWIHQAMRGQEPPQLTEEEKKRRPTAPANTGYTPIPKTPGFSEKLKEAGSFEQSNRRLGISGYFQ